MDKDTRSDKSLIERLIEISGCGLIAGTWCLASIFVLLGHMAAVLHQGGSVNRPAFYVGIVLVSSSVALGLIVGYLMRRSRSLKASVAIGIAVSVAVMLLGFAFSSTIATRLP